MAFGDGTAGNAVKNPPMMMVLNNPQFRVSINGRLEFSLGKIQLDLYIQNMSQTLINQARVDILPNYFGLIANNPNISNTMILPGNSSAMKVELSKGVNNSNRIENFVPYAISVNLGTNLGNLQFNVPFPLHLILDGTQKVDISEFKSNWVKIPETHEYALDQPF